MATRFVLTQVANQLRILPKDVRDPKVIQNNLDFMSGFAHAGMPTAIMYELLASREALNAVSSRSYEHVNHFAKIVVVDSRDPADYRLTVHYWNGNYSDQIFAQELIHNHRFSFWSYVYCGDLHTENFRECDDGEAKSIALRRYVYRPSQTGNIHSCEFDAFTRLEALPNITHKRGETYFLTYDSTHRVILPREGNKICTFVLRGPRQRDFTNTYNTFYPERGMSSNVPFMTHNSLKEKLEQILQVNNMAATI